MRLSFRCWFGVVLAVTSVLVTRVKGEAPDFGRDVRPILAKHCFTCHGPDPDARESDLRLDQQGAAFADLGGYAAIKPGDPDASEIIVRVTHEDAEMRMPAPMPTSGPPELKAN